MQGDEFICPNQIPSFLFYHVILRLSGCYSFLSILQGLQVPLSELCTTQFGCCSCRELTLGSVPSQFHCGSPLAHTHAFTFIELTVTQEFYEVGTIILFSQIKKLMHRGDKLPAQICTAS